LGLFVALSAGLLIGAQPVRAETTLVSSSPADGEKVATSPTQIVAVFSAAVPNNAVMQAVCEGRPAPIGTVTVGADGISLIATVTAALPIGTCNVTYSVPQADGKVATGGFSFEVLDPTTADPGDLGGDVTDGGNLAVDPPPVSGPLALFRILAYLSLAALFGGIAFIRWTWPEGINDDATYKFLRISWLVALVSNYVVAMLRASLLSGDSVTSTIIPLGWGELFHSASGISAALRVVIIAACAIVALRPDRIFDPQSQIISLALPTAAMATFGLTRVMDDFSALGTIAGMWLGGLVFLAQSVLIGPGEEDLMHAIRTFSRQANIYIGVTVVAGIVQFYQMDGSSILTSRHGRLIIVKVIGVAGMVYVGGAARQFINHQLAKKRELSGRTAKQLRKAVLSEIGIGILVLVFTSWSVATLPPNVTPPGSDRTNYAFVGDRSGGEFDVQLKVTPATVGLNAVRIDVYSPPTGLTDLTVQFNPPTNNTASVTLSVPLDGEGAARLPMSEGVPFGAPGLWTIIVTGNGPGGPLPSVTYTVSVMANSSDSATTGTDITTTSLAIVVDGSPATVVVPLGGTTVPGGIAPAAGIQPVTATVVTSVP
jgi:putative copper export protein/methionine-rich copper-binding protein CopC